MMSSPRLFLSGVMSFLALLKTIAFAGGCGAGENIKSLALQARECLFHIKLTPPRERVPGSVNGSGERLQCVVY
jgi:hypothetical protein